MSPPAGHTRCYWSLLSGDLQFIYLDPVLQYHLAEQAESLAGKSLLDFVHPDEQSSAKHDLGTVLESRTLHGSVTRVRFARLSKIRRDLGYTGAAPDSPAEDKIAVDANYMAVDVVINWAAEGLVLCFIHAIVDIDPAADNDQTSKTSWSNWCGTPVLSSEQVQMLFKRLLMCAPQTAPTARVFQILNNDTAKDLVISWPPADQPSTREFARLANDINVNVVNTDAKTSCTRRFKSAQVVHDVGHVESVFIPHGSVIFACHKVDSPPNSTMPSSYDHHTPYALPGAANPPYYPNPNPSAYSYQPPPPPWDRYYPPYEASRNHEGGGQYTYLPPPPSPPQDSVPPPRRRVSPPPPGQSQRGHGNRPVGVLKCSSCKATSSPEWRKGPSGRKELCNACGLRYARSRAKKEGSVPSSSHHHKSSGNGRKEKSSLSLNVVKREREQNSATPPRSAGSSVASSYDYGGAPGYDYYRSYRNGGGSGGSSPDGGGGGGGGGGGSNGSFPSYDDGPAAAGGRYYAHTSPLAAPPTTNGGVSYERRYEKWERDDARR
ncbi:hypothetical protein ARMSODRAFT_949870 [Armillaria solidipes]|uniref:GATA-type domain-containing protein n=1 Tax=Armillaria solidipes TaxID=1076256 RepID=A0A2H3C2S6_9AGAR|nr:hypothetical protein ARMSODRAFT_949870 [Armillaria solidipes]